MNKSKSSIVTAVVAIMLAVILVFAWRTGTRSFEILAGLLAVYGYLCAAANFRSWLSRPVPLLPATTKKDDAWEADEEFKATYDEIKREFSEGTYGK